MRVSGGVNKTSDSDPRSVLCAGSDNQQQEVTVVTSAGISISGAPDINSTNENSSPTGEDPENLWRSNSSCTKIDGNNLRAGCICENDQCSKASDPYSSFVSLSHTGPDKQGGSSNRTERGETTIPKNGSPYTGSPGRTSVVGQDCQDIQFRPINTTTSRSSNRDRCILVGLGCQVPGAPYQRPLVSGGTDDAYQCSRTPSSFSGNQNLLQGEGLPKYSHKPLRGHPLTNIELHSNPAVEMVPGSPGSPDSQMLPRGGEQDCGRGVQGGKGSLQLDDPSTSLRSDKHEMGPSGGGHVCLQANPSGSKLGAGPSSRSS